MTKGSLGVTTPHTTSHRLDRGKRFVPVKRGIRRIARKSEVLKRQLLDLNAQIVVSHDRAHLRRLLQEYVQAALALEQELSGHPRSGPVQTHPTPPGTAQDIVDTAIPDTPV